MAKLRVKARYLRVPSTLSSRKATTPLQVLEHQLAWRIQSPKGHLRDLLWAGQLRRSMLQDGSLLKESSACLRRVFQYKQAQVSQRSGSQRLQITHRPELCPLRKALSFLCSGQALLCHWQYLMPALIRWLYSQRRPHRYYRSNTLLKICMAIKYPSCRTQERQRHQAKGLYPFKYSRFLYQVSLLNNTMGL
jgi:hypothetical protein